MKSLIMSAPKKNQFWKKRVRHGRKPVFKQPEDLWNLACKYFEWCEDNPLEEEKIFHYQGEIVQGTVNKVRAFTVIGLCGYIGITETTFGNYAKKDQGFFEVIGDIKAVIYEQKFTGAAANLFNANIIARDLGLADRQKTETTEKKESYSDVLSKMTDKDLEEELALLKKIQEGSDEE